jgi:amino acid permease
MLSLVLWGETKPCIHFSIYRLAVFVPYFGDLTSITGAIAIVPLSFLLPIVFWNKVHGATAPLWRLVFHYAFAIFFGLLGVVSLVGAVSDAYVNVHEGN